VLKSSAGIGAAAANAASNGIVAKKVRILACFDMVLLLEDIMRKIWLSAGMLCLLKMCRSYMSWSLWKRKVVLKGVCGSDEKRQ
jgi:hypothetical protein